MTAKTPDAEPAPTHPACLGRNQRWPSKQKASHEFVIGPCLTLRRRRAASGFQRSGEEQSTMLHESSLRIEGGLRCGPCAQPAEVPTPPSNYPA